MLLVWIAVAIGCGGSPGSDAANTQTRQTVSERPTAPAAAPNVNAGSTIRTAKIESRTRTILAGGRLRPSIRIEHSVPVSGLVRSVAVQPGSRVSAGQPLFTVERNDIGQTFRPVPVDARTSGIVSRIDVTANTEVKAGDPGVLVVGTDGYTLEAAISDRDAAEVGVDQAVRATSANGAVLSGRLIQRSQEPDYATGLFVLTFEFPKSKGSYIGEFLLVEVPTESTRGIFVPRDAVLRRYGRYFLWIVGEDSRLARREIVLAEAMGDELRVASGLRVGERYLSRPSGREREGALAAPAARSQ